MGAPFFLVTIVTVLALTCGPWQCNASKSFGVYLYLSFYFLAVYSDKDQEQITNNSFIPKYVLYDLYIIISSFML